MSKSLITLAHYEYIDHLVQILGFTNLCDFTSSLKCSDFSYDHVLQVNATLDTFRSLFKLHDFNLSRYEGCQLQTTDQLLTFYKKIFTMLDINYEIYRYKGENFLRLKPENPIYTKYIEKMATERQKIKINPIATSVDNPDMVDPTFYQKAYQKVSSQDVGPIQYYYRQGKQQDHLPNAKVFRQLYPTFDLETYVKHNIDLKGLTNEELMSHFHHFGRQEHRIYERPMLDHIERSNKKDPPTSSTLGHKQMKMSDILTKYKSTSKQEEIVYFKDKFTFPHGDYVITYVETGYLLEERHTPFKFDDLTQVVWTIGDVIVTHSPQISDLALPITFLPYHEVNVCGIKTLPRPDTHFYLKYKSIRLNQLQFEPLNVWVILDDPFFKGHSVITSGMFAKGSEEVMEKSENSLDLIFSKTQIVKVGTHQYQLQGTSETESTAETCVIRPDGTQMWYLRGQLHREGDQPAVIYHDGTLEWYIHGKLQREFDQPAVIEANGTQRWYLNGQRHRNGDQPAIKIHDGHQEWYLYGKLHRDGDQPAIMGSDHSQEWWMHDHHHRDHDRPAIVQADGTQMWYLYGFLHREGDRPAILRPNGSQEWWKHGMLHREGNQPAVIHSDGRREWWMHGMLHREDGQPIIIFPDGTLQLATSTLSSSSSIIENDPPHVFDPQQLDLFLATHPEIDGVESFFSENNAKYTHFTKNEDFITLHYIISRYGDLIRQVKIQTKDALQCRLSLWSLFGEKTIFEGLYQGQWIEFKPLSLVTAEHYEIDLCIRLSPSDLERMNSHVNVSFLYGLLQRPLRKIEHDTFDLKKYFS